MKVDTTTQGSWKGVFGTEGYSVTANAVSYPSYVVPQIGGAATWTWDANTTDVRALQAAGPGQRIAATWYSVDQLTVDLPFNDKQTHPFAVYCVDWDGARSERLDLLDATENVLDTKTITNFRSGVWVVWNIAGHVRLRLTRLGGTNAVISGVFFGL